ncbi:battenin-like [Strongylocentrotus purpuratus]|uniref:Battenin n=1 Tax=Strongylocentrotus purpuratus TaxID=7668 RepID=A0A7M7P7Z6_STRPU|nr:battenin-like [Strongylocentrotus purpuratus]XP_030845187.1 battenin-like [Strongylocentrotus purpuratus]
MYQPVPVVQLNNTPHFRRNWVGFFLLGLSNMLPLAMVSAGANSIARSYGREGFIAAVYGFSGSLTIVVKMLNAFVLSRLSYNIRFAINSLVLLLGIAGIAFAPNFITAIVAVVVIGGSYAFGESVVLGYLSKFDSRLVNAWSSGCGCAGLLGAAFLITFGCVLEQTTDKATDLRLINWYSFLACCPFVFIYLVAYLVVIVEPPQERTLAPVSGYSDNPAQVTDEDQSIQSTEQDALLGSEPKRFTMADRRRGFKLIWKLGLNLAAATFATYVCRVSSAKAEDNTVYDQNCPELYVSLQLCFMAAQFASLSSVQLIKIRKVQILSAVQLMNAVIWIVNTRYKFMPVYILPAYMVFIGLIMGAIYVNTFYMIHNDDIYPKGHRDLLANLTAMFLTLGVSLSSILMTALYKTVLLDF